MKKILRGWFAAVPLWKRGLGDFCRCSSVTLGQNCQVSEEITEDLIN